MNYQSIKVITFLLLPLFSLTYADSFKTYNIRTPSLGQTETTSLNIYFPKDYNSQKQYPAILYFHGADGNDADFIANAITPAANLINLDAIVIMPNLFSKKEPSFGNRHMCQNSEYYGRFEDVITKDIPMALKQSGIRIDSSRMAVGGFSMGADCALTLVAKKSNLYIAAAAHGSAPAIDDLLLNAPGSIVDQVKAESAGKTYSENNGYISKIVFGISAAWGALKNGDIAFLLNPDGSFNTPLHQTWMKQADVSTLILDHQTFSKKKKPSIYMEIGDQDPFKGFNDYFAFVENVVPSEQFLYVNSHKKRHGFDASRATLALTHLKNVLSRNPRQNKPLLALSIHSNKLDVTFSVEDQNEATVTLLDKKLSAIHAVNETNLSRIHKVTFNVKELGAGEYFIQVDTPTHSLTKPFKL